MYYYERSLADPLPAVSLPAGFQVRHVVGEEDGQKRAMGFPCRFWLEEAVRGLLAALPALHGLAGLCPGTGPGDRGARWTVALLSASAGWTRLTGSGCFEPVGTHPDFQRLGLGKAVMLEGLRRMQASGMQTAIVGAESDNLAAQGLYRSIGFQAVNKLWTYRKVVE